MTTPPKLILFSRSPTTRDEILREIDGLRSEFPDLSIVASEMSTLSQIDTSAQLVLLDLEKWVPSDEMALSDLRAAGYDGPVVVLSKRIDEAASASYHSEKIVFFDRARGMRELLGISRRMLMGSLIAARKHPRHTTNETAEIQIDGIRGVYICEVKNLSKGGALLVLNRALNIRIGDMMSVKIRLDQVNRVYSVRARVAWVNPPGIGVEFIGGL